MNELQKLREGITTIIFRHRGDFAGDPLLFENKRKEMTKELLQFLADKGLAIPIERALPIRFLHPDDKPNASYALAQQDMLKAKYIPIVYLRDLLKEGE